MSIDGQDSVIAWRVQASRGKFKYLDLALATIDGLTTDSVTEGSNLYYTDALATAAAASTSSFLTDNASYEFNASSGGLATFKLVNRGTGNDTALYFGTPADDSSGRIRYDFDAVNPHFDMYANNEIVLTVADNTVESRQPFHCREAITSDSTASFGATTVSSLISGSPTQGIEFMHDVENTMNASNLIRFKDFDDGTAYCDLIYSASPGSFDSPYTLNNSFGIYMKEPTESDSVPALTVSRYSRFVTIHEDLIVNGETTLNNALTVDGTVTSFINYATGIRLHNDDATGSLYSGYIQLGNGVDGELYIARRNATNDLVIDRAGHQKLHVGDYVSVAERLRITHNPSGTNDYDIDVLDDDLTVKLDTGDAIWKVTPDSDMMIGPGVAGGTSATNTTGTAMQTRFTHSSTISYIEAGKHVNDTTNKLYLTGYNGNDLNLAKIKADTLRTYDIEPESAEAYSLGASGKKWKEVWVKDAVVNASDSTLKRDIQDLTVGLDFVNGLRPVSWIWKDKTITVDDSDKDNPDRTRSVTVTHTRNHWGHISQEVKAVMDAHGVDSGLFIDPAYSGSEGEQGLRPNELIPVLVKAIQQLSVKNNALETRIAALEV